MSNESFEGYIGLLEVRLKAARRNTRILGAVLFLALLSLFFIGLSRPVYQREAVIVAGLLAVFALGFAASLSRVEALSAVRDLANTIMQKE